MKNFRKQLSLAMALIVVFSTCQILSSCSSNTNKTSSNTSTKSDETTISSSADTTLSELEKIKPDLPDRNFDGYTFKVVSRDDSMHTYPVHTRDISSVEENGDLINDAVYRRNAVVEEKYNIKIEAVTFNEVSSETLANQAVEKSVRAGDDAYDLLLTHMLNGASSAQKGIFLNWFDVPYIDLSKPYWCEGAVKGLSVGEKMFLSLSDFSISSNDNIYNMLFNKKLLAEYKLENPYDLVKNNKWTFDKLISMSKNAAKDLNGDTKMTKDDQYGLLLGGGQLNFMWAGGEQVTSKDEDNRPYLNMNTPRMVDIFEKTFEMRYGGDYTYSIASWIDPEVPKMFSEDKALFMTTQVGVIEQLRQMETNFGILPYPKFDEAQEKYGHYVDGHAPLMAIPNTASNIERTGIIIEALSYEAYKTVKPIYYDVMLNTKYTRDDQSSEMLDIIFNSRVFDFGYVYDNWSTAFLFNELLDAKKDTFVSSYEKKAKIAKKNIEKIIKAYDEIGV